jgi:hypothetical protein
MDWEVGRRKAAAMLIPLRVRLSNEKNPPKRRIYTIQIRVGGKQKYLPTSQGNGSDIYLGSTRYRILNFILKLREERTKILKSTARYVIIMGFPMIPLSGQSNLAAGSL